MALADKLKRQGTRRLLALDGGGIRGVITLEILAEMESALRKKLGRDETFVLADYFDYIAGTSTGAIIATVLALGKSVETIRDFYLQSGPDMFDKAHVLERFRYKYKDEKLSDRLKQEIGASETLGTDKLETFLMLVMRNATTDSPWPISNNPKARYNDRSTRPDSNLNLLLWQLVRASTAAPVFFPPETIDIGKHTFIFVDGGVTTLNNPALQLFLMATIEPYKLGWPAGEDKMLLVSVGTGSSDHANENLSPGDMNVLYHAASIPGALMNAAMHQQDQLCRVLGRCRHGAPIDREMGALLSGGPPIAPRLFTYARYNPSLDLDGLKDIGVTDVEPKHVQAMDSVNYIDDMRRVGSAYAKKNFAINHFEGFFDD